MAFIKEATNPQTRFIEGKKEPVKVPRANQSSVSETYALALGKPVEDVESDIEGGFMPMLYEDASQRADKLTDDKAHAEIEGILQIKDKEEAQRQLGELAQRYQRDTHVAPDIATILEENPEYDHLSTRYGERQMAARRIVNERLSEAGQGILPGLGYFVDMAVTSGINSPLGAQAEVTGIGDDTFEGAGQLIDLAKEASSLLYADVSPEEFEREFGDILDRVADAGFFSETNPFYISTFVDLMDEAGRGGAARTERAFQILDIAGGAVTMGEAAEGVARISKATRLGGRNGETPRNIAKMSSRESAETVVTRQADNLEDTDMVSEGTSVSAIAPGREGPEHFAGPELQNMRMVEANNTALDIVKNFHWGSMVDPKVLARKAPEILTETRQAIKGFKRHEIDYKVTTGPTGNVYGSVYLGKRGGQAYKTQASAQKLADKVGGEVIEQLSEGNKGFVIRKDVDIPTEGMADPTDIKQISSGMLSGLMSTTYRTTFKLDAMLKRGEAATAGAVKEIKKNLTKATKAATRVERQQVDDLIRQVRDNPNYNWRTDALNDSEFSNLYREEYGTRPTEGAKNFYKALRDLSDTDYYINADLLLKEAINNKEKMVKLDGVYYRAKLVNPDTIDPDDVVYNADTGKFVNAESLDEGSSLTYEIKDAAYEVPGGGNVRYVTGNEVTTRRMYHTDVLPYNMGGHRKYTDRLDFFIKQANDDLDLAGGGKMTANPNTFMGVRLEKEAEQVVNQWNTIADAVRRGVPEKELNDIIRVNNDWNDSIEDIADLQSFADDYGLDITKDVAKAGDGEPLPNTWAGQETVGSKFIHGMNSSKRRGSRPLVGMGGDPLETFSPTEAIKRGFSGTVAKRGDQRYIFNAVNGWKQAAEATDAVTNPADLAGLSARQWMEKAQLRDNKAGRALKAERETIRFRMSSLDETTQAIENVLGDVSTFIQEKAGRNKMTKKLDDLAKSDPTGFLRKIAFNAYLGLFNVRQYYMQASQILNMAPITGFSPERLAKTSATLIPMRVALLDNLDNGAAALAEVASRQVGAGVLGKEEFIELRNWIKATGRNVVDSTVIEENNSFERFGGIVDKTLEAGQVFFNEGERTARLTASIVSYLEHKKRYPGVDIFSDEATDWMIRRSDILTASMTSASGARWQKSIAAVPFQFTTYLLRMGEQLFTNKILTKGERARLGLTHVMLYGSAGVPFVGWQMDKYTYETDQEYDRDLMDLVRYGMVDQALSWMTGEETALSTQLAAGEGVYDMFKSFAEDGVIEVALGPSGQVTKDILGTTTTFASNLFNGLSDPSYDLMRIARNASSVNYTFNAWMAYKYGYSVSRRNDEIVLEGLTDVDAVLELFGIPNKEEEAVWSSMTSMMKDKDQLNNLISEVERLQNLMLRAVEDEDHETAQEFAKDIGAYLEPLSPTERDEVLNRLRYNNTTMEGMISQLQRQGKTLVADKLQEMQD